MLDTVKKSEETKREGFPKQKQIVFHDNVTYSLKLPQFNFRGEEKLQDWCTWKAVSCWLGLLYFRFSPRGFLFVCLFFDTFSIFSHLVLFKKCFAICGKKMLGTSIPVLQAEKPSGCGPFQSCRSAAPSCSPRVPALGTMNCPQCDQFDN